MKKAKEVKVVSAAPGVDVAFPAGMTFLLVGCGCVGQAMLPVLVAAVGADRVRVVAADDKGRKVASSLGVDIVVEPLTKDNLETVVSRFVGEGDFVLNASVDVSSFSLASWCLDHGVMYLDTCVEPWEGGYEHDVLPPERTTNAFLRDEMFSGKKGKTCVIAHGANPGVISHIAKEGLVRLGELFGVSGEPDGRMLRRLGVHTIQIAERDSQELGCPRKDGFSCSWSPEGLEAEAGQFAELGLGSHEDGRGLLHEDSPRKRHVFLGSRGCETRVLSWVPSRGEQQTYLIPHHESLSLSDAFLLEDENGEWRPTVMYAYSPPVFAEQGLSGVREGRRFSEDEYHGEVENIVSGADELGVLFVGDFGSFWYGSTVDIETARAFSPCWNATTMQVVSGIICAMSWMFSNPDEGVVEAEDMDWRHCMSVARPLLGKVSGVLTDWTVPPGLDNFLIPKGVT